MGEHLFWVRIEAPPARVWHTYADPRRIPEWQTGRPVVEDVHGSPGEPGSTYVSRRGRFAARTTVLAATFPVFLATRTDAYLGLRLELTSRLVDRDGGTDLELTAVTHWPRGRRLVGRMVDRAILSPREAEKELANLRSVVERGAPG